MVLFGIDLGGIDWGRLAMPAFTWGGFLAFSLLFYVLAIRRLGTRFSVAGLLASFLPTTRKTLSSAGVDLFMYFTGRFVAVAVIFAKVTVFTFLSVGIAVALGSLFGAHDKLTAGPLELLVLQVALFIAYEIDGFLWHYSAHKNPVLWELHKVHHSALYLVPLTAGRVHPLEMILQKSLESVFMSVPAGIAMVIYDVSPAELLLLTGFVLVLQVAALTHLQHSTSPVGFGPLDRIFISPHMHQFHHSATFGEWDRNFGNTLSIFDWMCGTAVIPPRNKPIHYGIGRGEAVDREYQSIYGSYVKPLISMVRVMFGWRSPHERVAPAIFPGAPPPAEVQPKPVSPEVGEPVTIGRQAV